MNAAAVVAKPLGTRTPASLRCRYISPSDAFFPPTVGTSSIEISSNHATRLCEARESLLVEEVIMSSTQPQASAQRQRPRSQVQVGQDLRPYPELQAAFKMSAWNKPKKSARPGSNRSLRMPHAEASW